MTTGVVTERTLKTRKYGIMIADAHLALRIKEAKAAGTGMYSLFLALRRDGYAIGDTRLKRMWNENIATPVTDMFSNRPDWANPFSKNFDSSRYIDAQIKENAAQAKEELSRAVIPVKGTTIITIRDGTITVEVRNE